MAERLDTQTKQLRLLHAEFDATLARMVELQRELAQLSIAVIGRGLTASARRGLRSGRRR
jgi:hypothetical protein